MSCMWCARFSRAYDDVKHLSGEEYLMAPGECTLNPVRVQVSGAHVCSSFVWERIGLRGDGTAITEWWRRARTQSDDRKALRKEIKRLKEVNRSLREKLKSKE